MASLAAPFLVAAGTLAVYWPSLGLPLAFDDAWSVRLVQGYTVVDAFTRTANFGYYRPLYLLAYILAASTGASGPLLLHGLCLAFHILNALLLMRFARHLLGRSDPWFELGAGALFALGPFAFQAVALPAGLNHVLALFFILVASLAYVRLRASASLGWGAVSLAACGLAFLSNEIGVAAPGFCLVYEISRRLRGEPWTRRSWSFLAAAALSAAYLAIYPLIPKGQPPETVATVEDVAQRALYALQLGSYLVAALLNPATPVIGSPEAVAGLAAGMAGLAGLAAARGRWRVAVACGALLFAGACLPPLARLSSGYLLNAPRALYVPLAGAAILWAGVLPAAADGIGRALRSPRAALAARGVLLAASLWIGAGHASSQLDLHLRVHRVVGDLAAHAAQAGPDDRVLALNLPEWVAPVARHFPIGSEGVIVMAPYVDGADLVLANTGLWRSVASARYPLPYQPDLPYVYQAWGQELGGEALAEKVAGSTRVIQTRFLTDTLRADWVGGVEPAAGGLPQVVFAGQLALGAYHIAPCRDGWMLATRWRRLPQPTGVTAVLPPTLSVFAQAFDGRGVLKAQADGSLLDGLLRMDQVPVGAEAVDRRLLAADAATPGSGGTLLLGVYDYQTGERLTAISADGRRLDGDAWSAPLPAPDPAVPCR